MPRRSLSVLLLSVVSLLCVGEAGAQALPVVNLTQPRVRIGAADGAPEYLLFGARQALRAADGRIFVINFGHNDIREFDSTGRHQRTLGRRGDGPGEFRMLQQIGLINGDSLIAYDSGLGRVTVFSPNGAVARSYNIEPFGNAVLPTAAGFTGEGGVLIRTGFDRQFRPGPRRDTVLFAVTDAAGAPRDTLGRYAAEERFMIATTEFAARRTIAFGRALYASARGERLVIGMSDDFSFDVFFAGGRARRTYTQPWTPRRVTRAELGAADREYLATVHGQFRPGIEARIAEFPHRDTYPAYGDLLAAADGRVWVQHYSAPGSAERRWTVIGVDGRPQLEVRSAVTLRIVDAGADYALAHTRDDLGIERVLLFDLNR